MKKPAKKPASRSKKPALTAATLAAAEQVATYNYEGTIQIMDDLQGQGLQRIVSIAKLAHAALTDPSVYESVNDVERALETIIVMSDRLQVQLSGLAHDVGCTAE